MALHFGNAAFNLTDTDGPELVAFDNAFNAPTELALIQSQFFNHPFLQAMPDGAIVAILQDRPLAPALANGDPGPLHPAGIAGKSLPALFFQKVATNSVIATFERVLNLHGSHANFPATCTKMNTGIPAVFTLPVNFPHPITILSAAGVAYFRTLAGGAYTPMFTSITNMGRTIRTLQDPVVVPPGAPTGPAAPATGHVTSAADGNPLWLPGSAVFSKWGETQKKQFNLLSFCYWLNDQDMTDALACFENNVDCTCDAAVEFAMGKIPDRMLAYGICQEQNFRNFIKFFCSKSFRETSEGTYNSFSLCLVTTPNVDGSPYIFKKGKTPEEQKITDPRLLTAIHDTFELIRTCLTPNRPEDKISIDVLEGLLNTTSSDLTTIGNMSSAEINAQVEFYNAVFYQFSRIHKQDQFKNILVSTPALKLDYNGQVSACFAIPVATIVAKTNQFIAHPESIKPQFGSVPIPGARKRRAVVDPASPALTRSQKRARANAAKLAAATAAAAAAAVVVAPIIPNSVGRGSGGGANSIHCVNEAALLMSAQWPAGAKVPTGCNPTNGIPCTRSHTMAIVAGTAIKADLKKDLMNGIPGFAKNPEFQKNFRLTINKWK